MTEPIRLFVSSSPDLAPEREALGQAVAELWVSVGWEIKHTPRPGEDLDEALGFLARCDLFLVVLGADFAAPTTFQRRHSDGAPTTFQRRHSDGAPIGLEWRRALSGGKQALAYRKRVLHSSSAQQLLGEWDVAWTAFETPQELKAHATQALAQTLLDRGEEFGLHLDDVEGLMGLVEAE